jgi:hypothetical protein
MMVLHRELLRQIDSTFAAEFNGCTPHFVINLLDRKKLDGNRDLEEAADGNEYAEDAWYAFHEFIEAAKDSITAQYDAGLYIDLHGHGHDNQRLELGYLLYEDELALEDSILNNSTYVGYSSIRHIAESNPFSYTHADLLKGPNAFGTFLSANGFPAVPSLDDPYPLAGEPYFSGGYNTDRHGSRFDGTIDAIQIECNMDGVRDTYTNRQAFAEAFMESYLSFMLEVYGIDIQIPVTPCHAVAVSDITTADFRLLQNPVSNQLLIEHAGPTQQVQLLNYLGECVQIFTLQNGYNQVWLSVPAGMYMLSSATNRNQTLKLVVE